MRRKWKLGVVASCLAAVCAAGVAVAATSGKSELTRPRTIHVTTTGGTVAFLPLNPNTKTEFGDQVVISAPVFRGSSHHRIGRLHAICTLMDKQGVASECTITSFLPQGDIVVHGLVDFGVNNRTVGAVTGGTGEFRNARGQVIFLNSSGNSEGLIYQLQP